MDDDDYTHSVLLAILFAFLAGYLLGTFVTQGTGGPP